MRFKTDENLPEEAAEILRAAGHDASSVVEQGMGGEDDPRLIDVCREERRVLVTLDLDFSNIGAYPPECTAGLVVFRLVRQNKERLLKRLEEILPLISSASLDGSLWTVEEHRVRIRS